MSGRFIPGRLLAFAAALTLLALALLLSGALPAGAGPFAQAAPPRPRPAILPAPASEA